MLPIRIEYFLDVLSQWCLISDKSLLAVRMRYADKIPIRYRFVPISGRDPIYVDAQGQRKAYARSTFMTGIRTTPWLREAARSTWQANVAVVAAAQLGADLEKARAAVSSAALQDGMPLGEDGVAAELVASLFGISRTELEKVMEGAAVRARMEEDLDAFVKYGLSLRPAFVMENEIGDWTILNGAHRESLLIEVVTSLIVDGAGYDWNEKHIEI